MRTTVAAAVLLALMARPALAQNEAALRAALEGKTVVVKVDMPATSEGIDVFPENSAPVNWREMADRMKDNGTALKIGQTIMITKVVVKRGSHIEVQLGGGGYGTFGDRVTNSSSVSAQTESESVRERQLRDSIKVAPNATVKRQLERELSNARSARERENARAQAEAAQANEAREANLRVKRAESGSRFNLRYRQGIPPAALTVDGLLAALAPYAELANGATFVAKTASPSGASGVMALKKGLSIAEVERLLGPANTATETREGSLTVMKRSYLSEGRRIQTAFVNDVLIDFTIAPQ